MFGQCCEFALAVSSKGQTGLNVLGGEVWEVGQNLFVAHAAREIFQDIRNSHSHPANTGFAATFSRLDGNELAIIHAVMIAKRIHLVALGLRDEIQ